MRRLAAVLFCLVFVPVPAHAQLPVIDPGNLVQTVLIAQRVLRMYEELLAQSRTLQRMATGLGNMEAYRIPAVPITRHDTTPFPYGRPWLDALNNGDPTGAGYWRTTRRLERPNALLARLPPAVRQTIERAYATIEIVDSTATLAGHQVGALRGYTGRLQQAVDALEDDVLSGLLRYHELTTNLDKIAAGELLGRRQDMASNQLLSHSLEQLLARNKRLRDTEVVAMNMQLTALRAGPAADRALIAGTGDDLQTWRQP